MPQHPRLMQPSACATPEIHGLVFGKLRVYKNVRYIAAISVVGDEDLFGCCGDCLFTSDRHGRRRPVTDVVHIDLHVVQHVIYHVAISDVRWLSE